MKLTFSFNHRTHDLWPVYQAIQHYYPIGVAKYPDSIYYQYPGIRALEELIVDNIHLKEHYQERWVTFSEYLAKQLDKPVVGTTYGQAPSFSGFVLLDSVRHTHYLIQQELHFAVSLLGPFYAIYGVDTASFSEKQERKRYQQSLVWTVSPFEEYELVYSAVQAELRQRFPGYKLVPYACNAQIIEGLQVGYRDSEENTIYHALFNESILSAPDKQVPIRGDVYYGYTEWQK